MGASIDNGTLTWKEGKEIPIRTLSATTFQMHYVGTAYNAELREDGKLHWDDGDVWSRQAVEANREPALCPPLLRDRASHQQLSDRSPKWQSREARTHQAPPKVSSMPWQPYSRTSTHCKEISGKALARTVPDEPARKQSAAATHAIEGRQACGKSVVVSMPVNETRYEGIVTKFRGSYGWLESTEVDAKYPGRCIFLHANDCDFKPKEGDWMNCQLSLDVPAEFRNRQVKAVRARHWRAPPVSKAPSVINARDFFGPKPAERQRVLASQRKVLP